MQAKEGVIERLNAVLTNELTAVNQYFLQAEMCRNWGLHGLHEKLREFSMMEMKDAQELIQHILYLEGLPNLQRLGPVRIGENALEHLQIDLEYERATVDPLLREAITHCAQVGDYTTRKMFEEMIEDEEQQVDWLETQMELVTQIGLQNYLTEQSS